MVTCDRPATNNVHDPFDSINQMLDKLELESKRTKNLIEEPWHAYYPGQKASSIEEPRAGSSNSRNQPQRITPPQGFIAPPRRQQTDENQPPHVKSTTNRPLYRSSTAPQPMSTRANGQQNFPTNPRVVKSNNWINKNERELREHQPSYANNYHRQHTKQPASAPPVPQLRFDFDLVPNQRHYSEPQQLLYDYDQKTKKKKHSRKNHNNLESICRRLTEFREVCYKGSLREHEYRLQQVEESQRRSVRNSRLSCHY